MGSPMVFSCTLKEKSRLQPLAFAFEQETKISRHPVLEVAASMKDVA